MRTSVASAIEAGIRRRIASGEWEGRLPSEPELGRIFGASRETVRRALATLEGEGLLYRAQGRGTFVEQALAFNPLTGTLSITEELARIHVATTNRVLAAGWAAPSEIPSSFLRGCLSGEARVFLVRRLRLAREAPLAVEDSCFAASAFPDLEGADLTGSLHALMTTRYGLGPDRIQNRLQALDFELRRDREAADLLGSRQVLRVERVLSRKRRVYYGVGFTLRTDLYPLEFIQLPGRNGGGVL